MASSSQSRASLTATNKEGVPSASRVAAATAASRPSRNATARRGAMPIRPRFARTLGVRVSGYPAGSSSTNAGFEHNSRPKISAATGAENANDRGAFTLTLTSRMSSSKIERSASSSSHTSSEYTYASSSSSSSSSPQMPSSEGEARKWRATNATAASTSPARADTSCFPSGLTRVSAFRNHAPARRDSRAGTASSFSPASTRHARGDVFSPMRAPAQGWIPWGFRTGEGAGTYPEQRMKKSSDANFRKRSSKTSESETRDAPRERGTGSPGSLGSGSSVATPRAMASRSAVSARSASRNATAAP